MVVAVVAAVVVGGMKSVTQAACSTLLLPAQAKCEAVRDGWLVGVLVMIA